MKNDPQRRGKDSNPRCRLSLHTRLATGPVKRERQVIKSFHVNFAVVASTVPYVRQSRVRYRTCDFFALRNCLSICRILA